MGREERGGRTVTTADLETGTNTRTFADLSDETEDGMRDNAQKNARRGGRTAEAKPVVVRNRDIITLSKVLYVMASVCSAEQRRVWIKERMDNITQRYGGIPGSGGGVPPGLDATFAAIAEIDEEHAEKLAEYARVLKAAETILNGIQSQSMRTFVEMKYIMDIPNQEIMRELRMTRRRFEAARRSIEQAPNMMSVIWRESYIIADADM